VHLLIGMSADKPVDAFAEQLRSLMTSATCTRSRESARALDPLRLAASLRPYCDDVHVMADPLDAYTYVLNAVDPADVIIVTGSLFLVGEVRAALRRAHIRPRLAAAAG
jgi:dihydrofolate synthase/folylpolyglutamate synthase